MKKNWIVYGNLVDITKSVSIYSSGNTIPKIGYSIINMNKYRLVVFNGSKKDKHGNQ